MSAAAREAVARQFGAAIDMLENSIQACPEAVWAAGPPWQQFWYLASHTLFWLDYDLSDDPGGFRPPPPFGMEEMDPAGVLPPRVYTQAELLAYLAHGRARCRAVMAALDDAAAERPTSRPGRQGSVLESHAHSLRHVAHHVGQLQLLLRQAGAEPPRWVWRGAGEESPSPAAPRS